jgi:hypothetical protein
VGLRAAGQALGGPGATVIQQRIVRLGEGEVAEQAHSGVRRAAVGAAGLQGGDPGRLGSVGRADIGRGGGVPGGDRNLL